MNANASTHGKQANTVSVILAAVRMEIFVVITNTVQVNPFIIVIVIIGVESMSANPAVLYNVFSR